MHILEDTAVLGCILSFLCTDFCSIGVLLVNSPSDSPAGVEAELLNSIDIRLLNELRASTIVSEISHKDY